MPEQSTGCVLFADVSGSTKLCEAVGDSAANAAIDLCVKLFAGVTEQHGGRVVKTLGDEVMAVFADASRAAQAAIDIQLAVNDMAPVEKVRLGVRIGLSHGALVERDGEIFGDAVNLAARLAEMASKGQIVTSRETAERFEPVMACRLMYSIPVRDGGGEVEICELLWSDADDATQRLVRRGVAPAHAGTTLRLLYRGRTLNMPADKRALVMGRDATTDLVIADRMASRAHCEIEQRQDKFVIADRSANGTYLTIDGDREIVLRREESILRGHGFIALGQSRATASEVVEFFCD